MQLYYSLCSNFLPFSRAQLFINEWKHSCLHLKDKFFTWGFIIGFGCSSLWGSNYVCFKSTKPLWMLTVRVFLILRCYFWFPNRFCITASRVFELYFILCLSCVSTLRSGTYDEVKMTQLFLHESSASSFGSIIPEAWIQDPLTSLLIYLEVENQCKQVFSWLHISVKTKLLLNGAAISDNHINAVVTYSPFCLWSYWIGFILYQRHPDSPAVLCTFMLY